MIEQWSAARSVVGLAVSEPRPHPVRRGDPVARWKYDRLSAAGLIGGVTRAR